MNYDIYTVSNSGTDPVLIAGTSDSEIHPAWSPDGTRIAYARGTPGAPSNDQALNIYVVDAEGGEPRRITTGYEDTNPAWSPDGALIVFQRRGPGTTLWVIDPEGANERELTFGRGPDVQPAWSPDGEKIAFASHRDNPQMDIFVMDATGDNMINLTPGADGGHDRGPTWSPDGKKIAFASDRAEPLLHVFDIYVMNADGTNLQRLTTNLADDREPVWSPDGTKILFQSDRGGSFDLYAMDAGGGSVEPITNGLSARYPDWQSIPAARHVRSVSLRLKRHLVATGTLTVEDGFAACGADVQITILRRRPNGDWVSVASTSTSASGSYRVRIPDRKGRYRALAPLKTVGTSDMCASSQSTLRRHRH